MKKCKMLNIITMLIAFILIATNYTYASKEDLEKEYTKSGGIAADEFVKIFNRLNTDGDRSLSMSELKEASDEEINTLAKMSQLAAAFSPTHHDLYTNSSGAIDKTYKDRREQYGLAEDNDTTAGNRAEDSGNEIRKYYPPEKVGSTDTSTKGIDDMMGDADKFIRHAQTDIGQVNQSGLQHFSSTFYNIFLTAGTAIAVIAGMVIGIKYMMGSIEEKADIKTMLLPYVVGCIVVFGSFGIWKLIIEIMQEV